MSQSGKVLIIGLDGFTWKLGRRFMAEGVMPNMARLVKTGCHGNLCSVMPYETCPAWTSFQTGCHPGKTGIFSFFKFDRDLQKTGINNFSNIAVPTIWELADRAGKRVVSLNMPITSPPPKVNGVIIPGLLCPQLSRETVHPPEAYDRYIKPQKNYRIVNMDFAKTLKEFVDHQVSAEQIRSNVALQLMKEEEWDIFSVQMQSTDHLQHVQWWALDPEAHGYCPEAYKEVSRLYRTCDEAIGKLVETAGSDVTTFIVSDHGFCGVEHSVWPNVWLKHNGYLHLRPAPAPSKQVVLKERIKNALPPLKLLARCYGNILKYISDRQRKPMHCHRELIFLNQAIDYSKTTAIGLGALGIMIYIKGTLEQRQKLGQEMKGEILRDLGPESSQPVITKIGTGAEVYGSECEVDSIPDLVLTLAEGVYISPYPMDNKPVLTRYYSTPYYKDKQTGTHTQQGIMIISGPGVVGGKALDASLVDIIPTVMAHLGLPVPRHMDGQVLSKAFANPLSVQYEDVSLDKSERTEYSDTEQALLEKNLADLGYL